MRSFNALVFLLGSIPSVFADVKFTIPAAGQTYPAATALTVTWADSGTAPAIADLSTYTLFLCTGSNASPTQLMALGVAGTVSAGTIAVTIPTTAGAVTPKNAYFLKMISAGTAGGTVINYSNRFSLTGMTGVFSAADITALAAVTGTTGPPSVNAVVKPGAAASTGVPVGDGANYQMQTGTIRYAAMQPIPPTKITATNTKPIYPTSAVTFAATFLPIASVVTTVTAPQTNKFSSHANTAAAASHPVDDMQRFLNRWKD